MKTWVKVGVVDDFHLDVGSCVKHGDNQIAVFNFGRDEWYAVQNLCPHKKQMVLSRGLTGCKDGEPKVACPLHKRQFSLKTGEQIAQDEDYCLRTYPVKVEDGSVFLELSDEDATCVLSAEA